ncbi:hypothetical protein B0H14DRAFT_1339687 [Mycena olivaceomarginata]|nr:hypothetical protein B0H14DRAFT_1339687 [Mycena olivaceomarginata]
MFLRSPVNTNVGYPGISKYTALINPGTCTAGPLTDSERSYEITEAELRRLPTWAQPAWLQEKSHAKDAGPTATPICGDSGNVRSPVTPKGTRLPNAPPHQLLCELEDQQLTMAGYVWDEELSQWMHPKRSSTPTGSQLRSTSQRKTCRRRQVDVSYSRRGAHEAAKISLRRTKAKAKTRTTASGGGLAFRRGRAAGYTPSYHVLARL